MKFLSALFSKPKHSTVVSRQLSESRLQLLEAESAREYHEGLCNILTARISRLENIGQVVLDQERTEANEL